MPSIANCRSFIWIDYRPSSRASVSETRGPYSAAELRYCGVWVPAFAGTTGESMSALALPNTSEPAFLGVERSATGKIWRDRLDARGAARALSIAQRHAIPELLARVLAGRGVEPEDAQAFLDPSIKRLMPDPSTLTDMDAAAARLADAVVCGEQIAIFGDYDVDGATSSALLCNYLRA